MCYHHLLALYFLLACLHHAIAQDNTTQPQAVSTTGMTQMDTSQHPARSPRIIAHHGLNISFLEENVQQVMDQAISDGDLPGGVVVVLRGDDIAFVKAYGNRAVEPTIEPATVDTIYDVASLTKPIATATSIMKLMEQGRLRLTDSVEKFIPEWKNSEEENSNRELLRKLERAIEQGKITFSPEAWKGIDQENQNILEAALDLNPVSNSHVANHFSFLPRDREAITIKHLLVHTSGLPSFLRYYEKFPGGSARMKIVSDIAQEKLRGPVGGQFTYSDLGFIVLGDLVERISGMPLDEFSQKEIFQPLGMHDTMFTPPEEMHPNIAPTEWTASKAEDSTDTTRTMIRGMVHDGNAKVQDGVSGHAGLFSTAQDLAKYFQMMMRGGAGQPGQPNILSPATIRIMTQNHSDLDEGPGRGYGWDLTSGYSSQKGDIFNTGYGHTGFTGTSVWVVPEEKLAILILSNRVHPNGGGNVTTLRAQIANIVAGSILESHRNELSENQ